MDEHWKMRNLPLMTFWQDLWVHHAALSKTSFQYPAHSIVINARWLIIELEVSLCGLVQSFIFGALPSGL